jgi:hypothetical protein
MLKSLSCVLRHVVVVAASSLRRSMGGCLSIVHGHVGHGRFDGASVATVVRSSSTQPPRLSCVLAADTLGVSHPTSAAIFSTLTEFPLSVAGSAFRSNHSTHTTKTVDTNTAGLPGVATASRLTTPAVQMSRWNSLDVPITAFPSRINVRCGSSRTDVALPVAIGSLVSGKRISTTITRQDGFAPISALPATTLLDAAGKTPRILPLSVGTCSLTANR